MDSFSEYSSWIGPHNLHWQHFTNPDILPNTFFKIRVKSLGRIALHFSSEWETCLDK